MSDKFDDWGNNAMRGSICGFCKHKFSGMKACAAFLTEIPADFLSGRRDHTELIGTEDQDFVFEKAPGVGKLPREVGE